MPLPLLFIGVAATTGSVGIGKSIKAGVNASTAQKLNKTANELVQDASARMDAQRLACGRSLTQLGEEKLFVLNSSVKEFLDAFTQIKNVDLRESEGLDELGKLHIDEKDFVELQEMAAYAGSLAGGAVAGTTSGALIAFGAYNAAKTFAFASTGTAISALHGAAATNATLAFFGGGSLAANGLGMAGGTAVLGGLVAGPVLMVVGFVVGAAAKKNLEAAYTNKAEAEQLAAQLDAGSLQCEAIRRRTYMFYNLLARLDAYFLPQIYKLEDILKAEGYDYRTYTQESKKAVASCASIAVTIKAVLDTPLLTEDGNLTEESEKWADGTFGSDVLQQ